MLRESNKQMNMYSILYERIPEKHLLKQISRGVDFSFINEMLADSYCRNLGRPAKEPEMMAKLCILEHLYNLSDEKVMEETQVNLAYMWFVGINPDEKLPDPSLLSKFRTQRLKTVKIDDIMTEIVRQCVEKGIIKGTTLTIDTTHTEANCKKQVPERIMKRLAKKLFKSLAEDHEGKIPEGVNTEIPDYKSIEEPSEAKQEMKAYLEEVVEQAEQHKGKKTKEAIEEINKTLSDEKFMVQKGQRSLTDKDARVGYKSKTESFFGYKTEITMTAEDRIITAVEVHGGEYVDGTKSEELLDRTIKSGVKVEAFSGDRAYFRKDILEGLEKRGIESIIPVSASAYKMDEEQYSYNKDSDEWICRMGNRTIRRKQRQRTKNGAPYSYLEYSFDKAGCKGCPHREECMGKASGGKKLIVSKNTAKYYEESQRQKTDEFKEKYRKRAAIEWKNAELKRFHGMARARGWGMRSMANQAKLTAIAVNLKRIAALIRQKEQENALAKAVFPSFSCRIERFMRDLYTIACWQFKWRLSFGITSLA